MTTYSCILAWEIPWTEEPGGLQCIGSQRVRLKNIHFTLYIYCPGDLPSPGIEAESSVLQQIL